MDKGQCFNQPYLGCREFSCNSFKLADPSETAAIPIDDCMDLGFMLYDMDYSDELHPKPMFFRARMDRGVIMVPDQNSGEVRR
jgi:CRISPR-associated protein Cas5d